MIVWDSSILCCSLLVFSIIMAGPGMLSLSRTEKYCTKVADEILQLRGEKALFDFKIHVKDDVIPCSKFVMAVHSPMLRAMLTSDMAEVAKQEIRLDHIDLNIIQIILNYMYCENVSFHRDQLMDLIAAADYLQMTDLKEMCVDEVPGILEASNVIEWWKEAIKMNYDTIKKQCEEIMATNFGQISQQTDFLNLELDDMQHCMSDICGDTVKSDDAVDTILTWTNYEEGQIMFLEDLLHKVQLDKCSHRGLKAAFKTHGTLLDKSPMVYKLLFNALADVETDTVVIAGGLEGEDDKRKINKVCWNVNKSNEIVHMCDITTDDLGVKCSLCVIPQGFVITGGYRERLCMMFTALTKIWVRLQDLLQERNGHGSICVRNVLYVLGGSVEKTGEKCSNSVHYMELKVGKWNDGPSLLLAVKFPKVANIANTLYLLDAEDSKKLWHMDVDEGVWKELAPLPIQDLCHGTNMISARDRLFVTGGPQKVCAWYQPENDTWFTGQQPLQEHRYGALTYHNNKLLLLGGYFKEGGTDEVEEYNIDEDKWSLCNYKTPRKLCHHHAVVLNMHSCD